MKWGVRRYQNKDGGLTYAGRKHLLKEEYKSAKKAADRQYTKAAETWDKTTNRGAISNKKADKALDDAVNNKEVQSYSYKINADNIVNSHLDRARNDSLKTAFKNVYKYERSGGNYSGYVPSGALEVAWKRKR